tara:strand:- start:1116 stop:1505 length:390 start_codon:yes stop_codon:yes gene_type:complete
MEDSELLMARIHGCYTEATKSFTNHFFQVDVCGGVHFYLDSSNNPTQEQINEKAKELIAELPYEELREKRNQLLAETDWTQNRDVILADDEAWKTYRQALRDLPSTSVDAAYDENGNLINVVYPTKPGQ